MVIPIATVMTTASSQLSVVASSATRAIAGTKTSRTNSTNRRNCGARIGTQATQKV